MKMMAKINELRFELLPHPSYPADLTPSDLYTFINLKRWLQSQRFSSNEVIKWEIDGYFRGLDKSYYKRGNEMLNDRWTKCI